jgi:RimJ/RimL family protein N-acetyltransferase
MLRWHNDFDVIRSWATLPRPVTAEELSRIYAGAATSDRDIWFILYVRESMRPVGYAGLQQVDWESRSAEYAILIGEADARGRGVGSETTRLMLDYAFNTLGLHSVFLRVYEYNIAGIRAYTKAGFQAAGRLRQNKLMGGRLWDTIFMDCLNQSPPGLSADRAESPRDPLGKGRQ